jgi:hypothetical protein
MSTYIIFFPRAPRPQYSLTPPPYLSESSAKGVGLSSLLRGLAGLVGVNSKQRQMLVDRVRGLRIAIFKHSSVVGETREILEYSRPDNLLAR